MSTEKNKSAALETLAIQMDMASFQELCVKFTPDITVVVRGNHGIGKSQSVYQIAKKIKSRFYENPENAARYNWSAEKGLPVIERRLSQMTEGDIIGLPVTDGKSTSFKACNWLVEACERPVLLFLDERNRALEGVKQAVFQLMDSKAFYGYELHPETRIFVAENIGDQYSVNQIDPAELSRSAVIDLRPTVKDFLIYAESKCDRALVEYIRSNEKDLEYTGAFQGNKKYQDRRAWVRLDEQLTASGLYETPEHVMFYNMACSMIGTEIGTKFWKFCKERERDVKAIDMLTDAKAAFRRLGADTEHSKYVEIAHKIVDWLKENTLVDKQAAQLNVFLQTVQPEVGMLVWTVLSNSKENLFVAFPHIRYTITSRLTKKAM